MNLVDLLLKKNNKKKHVHVQFSYGNSWVLYNSGVNGNRACVKGLNAN